MAPRAKSPWLILGLLSQGPRSGYDIRREVEEATVHFWRESFGAIYPALARLVRTGLIRVVATPHSARGRRVYALTPKGKRALAQWLERPPEIEVGRSELMLKLYVGESLDPEVLAGHIRAMAQRHALVLDYLNVAERAIEGSPRVRTYRLLAIRAGQRLAVARLEWADEAIGVLSGLG